MNITLKELKDIHAESCVTIILNTHRTSPDNKKDPINLKNLCKEAEERLLLDESKRDAKVIIQRINDLAENIDHRYNLESLVLFVNEDIAEYTRLPIAVTNRVVIDHTFATRDLVRALNQEANYLVVVLSQQKVRLIQAFNDKVVKEYSGEFPIENYGLHATSKGEEANALRNTNLMEEFFNRVDKEVNKVRKTHPLPVLICSEENNYHQYLKVADHKETILDTFLNKNRLEEEAHQIVSDAWPIVQNYVKKKNDSRKGELKNAVSSGKFLSDINDIYKAIQAGKVETLFIEKGLFQAGVMNDDTIELVSDEEANKKSVTDDIYDELIEANMNYGGGTVFLPKGELADFDGFGAITRY